MFSRLNRSDVNAQIKDSSGLDTFSRVYYMANNHQQSQIWRLKLRANENLAYDSPNVGVGPTC